MTDKAKANLIRLLKASNPASRNLGKVLLERSDLSSEEQKQIEKECSIAPGWRAIVTNSDHIKPHKHVTKAQFDEWVKGIFKGRVKKTKPKIYNPARRRRS